MRKLALALAAAVIGVPAANAADVERVQVGLPGRNTTRAFSPQTFIVVTSPDAYVRTSFDGDSSSWHGPRCVVSSNPGLSDDVSMPWFVVFSDRYATREQAAAGARTFDDLPLVSEGTIEIPHRIRGREVGAIVGYYLLGQSTHDRGWAEIGVGIPLTRGVFAVARFWSTGPSFGCSVGGTAARQWHLDAAQSAAARLVVDGNLPAARISAHPQRRRVSGFVNDGFGHPVVGARVTLERKAGRTWRRGPSVSTNSSGFYSVLARAGTMRTAHGTLRSKPVRVR